MEWVASLSQGHSIRSVEPHVAIGKMLVSRRSEIASAGQ